MKCKCDRCGKDKSVFWHRFSYGCDDGGNEGETFILCDFCFERFLDFMWE